MKRGITFGVWDLLHYGHIDFLIKAKGYVDKLFVGVSSGKYTEKTKGVAPSHDTWERVRYLRSFRFVDGVFVYNAPDYLIASKLYKCNTAIIGEQFGFQGVPEHKELLESGMDIIRIQRTPDISSSLIRKGIYETCDCNSVL